MFIGAYVYGMKHRILAHLILAGVLTCYQYVPKPRFFGGIICLHFDDMKLYTCSWCDCGSGTMWGYVLTQNLHRNIKNDHNYTWHRNILGKLFSRTYFTSDKKMYNSKRLHQKQGPIARMCSVTLAPSACGSELERTMRREKFNSQSMYSFAVNLSTAPHGVN